MSHVAPVAPETAPSEIAEQAPEAAPIAPEARPDAPGVPRLSVADAGASESDGRLSFPVSLSDASNATVTAAYATEDGTATAGIDYAHATGMLRFSAGETANTITVTVLADSEAEGDETFTVALSAPTGATLDDASATGTIFASGRPLGSPRLSLPPGPPSDLASLRVSGGVTGMYPTFAADILHYALMCAKADILYVQARTSNSATRLTLLRAEPDDNLEIAGSMAVEVRVNPDNDIAIELATPGGSRTYVVHCLPQSFPVVWVAIKEPGVSDGLLFVTPDTPDSEWTTGTRVRYLAIIDNNGVPRFHRLLEGRGMNFQYHGGAPNGVRYSFAALGGGGGAARLAVELAGEGPAGANPSVAP